METQPIINSATETDDKSKWDNLTDELKEEVFNSKISCQGEQLTVRELAANNLYLLEELNLDAVLRNEIVEVGEPITPYHGYDERYYVHRTFLDCDKSIEEPIKEVFSTGNFDCERFSDYKEVVIADPSATGKSTAITNIALQYKHKNPGDLILMVDLNKCSKDLLGMSFKNQDEGTDFFIDKLVQSKHPKIFKQLFVSKRVVIFFDGSDELNEGALNVFHSLVTLLIKKRVHQVWYTTTNPLLRTTDNKLVVCMKRFKQSDQVEFIVKYWNANGANATDMRDTAKEIILKQENGVEKKVREKIGALFMSRMLAEIFTPPNHNTLPAGDLDVCWIYEQFLDTEHVKQHKKTLQYLAMKIAFRHTMETLGYEDEFGYVAMPDDLSTLHIVCPNGYGSMKFLHKTLGFYLVAEWFYERYLTEFASPEFKKIYAYDDNDNDGFLLNDSFDIMEFINRIANRKLSLMTDKEISKLGIALVTKHKKEKKENRTNTLGVILDHICFHKFFGLFNVILKSFSHPTIAKFINKHFDEVLYDENDLSLILRFEHKDCFRQSSQNAGLVYPMLEWAANHLTQENKQKMFSVKNDSDKCPFFWVVRGEGSIDYNGNIGYETIKRMGNFYAEAFADDKDKFYSLLFCSRSRKRKESSNVPNGGEAMPIKSDNNSGQNRMSIFFCMLWKVPIFEALFEICEETFGKPKLIELLRFTSKGIVFTRSKLLKISSANYQGIVHLLFETLGHEEALTEFVIFKEEGRASLCALLAKADLDIFEKGWKMMEQTFDADNLRNMCIVEARIHTAVFMAAISNPNLEIFDNFLQLIMKSNNDDLIDKTFQHSNLDDCVFSKSKPLMKSAEIHFDMAELWKILKCYATDIKNVSNNILYKTGKRTFLHIYIESHCRKDGFTDMFAKFWKTLSEDLDSSIVDYLLESEFLECFEYHTGCSRHDIINGDLERIKVPAESTQSRSCNIC